VLWSLRGEARDRCVLKLARRTRRIALKRQTTEDIRQPPFYPKSEESEFESSGCSGCSGGTGG